MKSFFRTASELNGAALFIQMKPLSREFGVTELRLNDGLFVLHGYYWQLVVLVVSIRKNCESYVSELKLFSSTLVLSNLSPKLNLNIISSDSYILPSSKKLVFIISINRGSTRP